MKLYLKHSECLNVTISNDLYEGIKYISVYYDRDNANGYSDVLFYSVTSKDMLILGDDVTELNYVDLQDINEIMQNFNQYYNMLEQVSMSKEEIEYILDNGEIREV